MTARFLARAIGDQARYDATRIGRTDIKSEVNSWVCGMQVKIDKVGKDTLDDQYTFSLTKGSDASDHGAWDVFTLTARQLLQLMKSNRVSLLNLYLEQGRCKNDDE